jgi:hypothetical protein
MPPTGCQKGDVVDDLEIVACLRDYGRPKWNLRGRVQKELSAGMMLAMPLDTLDERLIVILDKRARVSAAGYAHGDEFILLERMHNGRTLCHSILGPIVSRGSWSIVGVTAAMNSVNAWGSDGCSLSKVLSDMKQFERRIETSA